jgi:hypothetical protein
MTATKRMRASIDAIPPNLVIRPTPVFMRAAVNVVEDNAASKTVSGKRLSPSRFLRRPRKLGVSSRRVRCRKTSPNQKTIIGIGNGLANPVVSRSTPSGTGDHGWCPPIRKLDCHAIDHIAISASWLGFEAR